MAVTPPSPPSKLTAIVDTHLVSDRPQTVSDLFGGRVGNGVDVLSESGWGVSGKLVFGSTWSSTIQPENKPALAFHRVFHFGFKGKVIAQE